MYQNKSIVQLTRLAAAVALTLAASAAGATDLYLKAHRVNLTLPLAGNATTQVPMWTYSKCDSDFATNCVSLLNGGGKAGPLVTVPEGALTIHLRNELDEPTSVFMPAQPKQLNPVRAGDRITSFDTETAPGSTGVYTWQSPRRGTFLLQSGTHPQKQVQMGLHGALRVGDAVAPAGETPTREGTLVFSEIDPDLHGDGTSAGTFPANSAPAIRPVPEGEAPQGYAPKYFLVNGKAYTTGSDLDDVLETLGTTDKVSLHLINAGLTSHAPELIGGEFEVVAEDGYAAPIRNLHNATLLAAGKSLELLFKPTRDDTYSLLDRRLGLVSGNRGGSGMLVRFKVGTGVAVEGTGTSGTDRSHWLQPLVANDLFQINEGGGSVAASGVLANDVARSDDGRAAVPLNAELDTSVTPQHGSVTLAANGGFTYTPSNPQAFTVASRAGLPAGCTNAVVGKDVFQYYAVDSVAAPGQSALRSANPARVEVELLPVNDAPTTVDPDFYYVSRNDGSISVDAPGFLGNDIQADADCDANLYATNFVTTFVAGPYATSTSNQFSFKYDTSGKATGAFSASIPFLDTVNQPVGVSRFKYKPTDAAGLVGALGTVYVVRDAAVFTNPISYLVSNSFYAKSTATSANTNRWTIKVKARSVLKDGVAQNYDMKYYALSGTTATLIGTDTTFAGGTKTLKFSGAAISGFSTAATIDIRVDISVPADDTVPAHVVSLVATLPTK